MTTDRFLFLTLNQALLAPTVFSVDLITSLTYSMMPANSK